MKRKDRLDKILDIIKMQEVETQDDLQELLKEEGISTSQSTLSRDIRDLNLIKVNNGHNKSIYKVLPSQEENALEYSITEYALEVSRVEFMLVVKTILAGADLLATAFDEINLPEVLGTIAGADTLLVIAKGVEEAIELEAYLKGFQMK